MKENRLMMCRIFLFPLIALVIASAPFCADASLIPFAATSSRQSITATLKGSRLLYGVTMVETDVYSIALSAGSETLTYPAIHSTNASAVMGIFNDGATIATLNSAFSTTARAFSSEPLFSKSAARGQGIVYALVEPSSSPVLALDWTFNDFSLQTEPTSAFAYISNTIHVVQAAATGARETIAGFYTYLENGGQTTGFWGDAAVTQALRNWFDSNMTQTGNQVALNAGAANLTLDIALTPQQASFWLGIDTVHTEISYEAPPAATRRVEEQIGHLAFTGDTNQLHWDADAGLLSFDRLPINLLANGLNQSYQNDPLNGGFLEIDPLQLLVDSEGGRDYFSGKELRLIDRNGQLLYRASLPSLVFDDTLFANQGFNLFAPILNVLESNPGTSRGLRDYLANVSIDSFLLPELFIGFNPLTSDVWKQSFTAPVTTALSFSGMPLSAPENVSEPGGFLMLALGLTGLWVSRRYRDRAARK